MMAFARPRMFTKYLPFCRRGYLLVSTEVLHEAVIISVVVAVMRRPTPESEIGVYCPRSPPEKE